jgi:putative oxidoreductase
MTTFNRLMQLRRAVLARVEKIAWFGPLLARLVVGIVFLTTGWGKLHNLSQVTDFFVELHIPAPHAQAILVASTEFLGGLCLTIGLFTRLAALPLSVTMIVAILTAKRAEIDGVNALFGLEEFLYLTIFIWLAIAGPGKVSLDHLIVRRLEGPETDRGIEGAVSRS